MGHSRQFKEPQLSVIIKCNLDMMFTEHQRNTILENVHVHNGNIANRNKVAIGLSPTTSLARICFFSFLVKLSPISTGSILTQKETNQCRFPLEGGTHFQSSHSTLIVNVLVYYCIISSKIDDTKDFAVFSEQL
jgi:hypothetical protein